MLGTGPLKGWPSHGPTDRTKNSYVTDANNLDVLIPVCYLPRPPRASLQTTQQQHIGLVRADGEVRRARAQGPPSRVLNLNKVFLLRDFYEQGDE